MKRPDDRRAFSEKRSGSVAFVTFGQVAADRATGRATQARTDRRASPAAQAVTDHRTTCRANTATDSRFGTTALLRGECTTGRTRNTGAKRCTRAAAHFLADYITQRTTQASTKRSGTVTGSHCTLSNQ
jgi:hypothetical protein